MERLNHFRLIIKSQTQLRTVKLQAFSTVCETRRFSAGIMDVSMLLGLTREGVPMEMSTLVIYAATLAVACAVPGPTTAALVARVLGRGTQGALAFCGGLLFGDFVWLSATALGLAMLAATLQPVFIGIKYAGAAYLLYLAWKLWTAPAKGPDDAQPVRGEGVRLFLTGLSVCLGNPKTALFYLAL